MTQKLKFGQDVALSIAGKSHIFGAKKCVDASIHFFIRIFFYQKHTFCGFYAQKWPLHKLCIRSPKKHEFSL